MNLDEHNDYFLDEDENNQQPQDAGVIDFTAGNSGGANKPQDGAAPKKKKRKGRKFLVWFFAILVLILAVLFYIRYFNPYVIEARTSGYITDIEKRGIIFKTYEGTMATESAMRDSSRIYDRNFTFTVPDETVARQLQDLSTDSPRKVTLVYEKYYGMLPWRGGSTNVVTGIIEN